MTVVTSQIVKYCRNVFGQLKIYVTIPMCCTSKFTSYVTMISNVFFIIINTFFTKPTTVTLLKQMFFFCIHDQMFIKLFVHYFLAIFMLLNNCFNKFITSIFPSIIKDWLSKLIINTNKAKLSEATRNVILISFCVRAFITFNTS